MLRSRIAGFAVTGLIASTLTVSAIATATPASAVMAAQPNVVNAVPQANTPDVNDGTVFSIGQVGSQMFLGGTFTSVSPHGQPGTTYTRNNILAFNATTGAVDTGFVPTVNGEVDSIIPGPSAGEVYIGGSFSTVNGVSAKVALLNTTNGSIVSTWKPSGINGAVTKLVLANGMLFVGGAFTTVGGASHNGLVALNPTTGQALSYVGLSFTGHHNFGVNCSGSGCANGAVGIKSLDIDPSGTHLVAIGNFTSVGPTGGTASPRDQIALIDLGSSSATLDPNWATAAYTAACFSNAFDSYIRDVQFSPDGSYFVVVATGGSGTNSDGTNSSCDTAARYETTATGSDVRPTWIDYTGQDSFWSVAVTGTAVYCGGHERWTNNSKGYDYAGPGAVPRPGIAALSPTSGLALSWNPGRNPRGAGAYSLLATPTGLWVGSDTDYIGNRVYLHRKIAFFPLAGGETLPSDATATLPGKVYTAGGFPTPGSSNVLYRLNEGGPTISSTDNGPDWQGDDSGDSPYRNSGSNTAGWDPVANVDSTVPAGTPSAIFDSERWDPGSQNDGGEMHFGFPVPAGEKVDVRLYMANRCSCTSGVGQRVFDVAVDGQPFLNNFDIVAQAGDQTGTMRADTVTSDGEVDIDFTHETENPLIDGIEIVKDSAPATTTGPLYRINAGGGKIASTDASPADWLADDANTTDGDPTNGSANGTPFRTGGNTESYDDPWGGKISSSVPSTAPTDLFSTGKWGPEQYQFPVDPGTPVTVNLYMANNYDGTSSVGQREFNVAIDGTQVLADEDIVADVGNRTGEVKSFNVTVPASGEITVTFSLGDADNPVVNAIEVDQTGASTVQPSDPNRISYRHTSDNGDGTVTTGNEQAVTGTGISWGAMRGAFMVNGELVYGKNDGKLYERSFDGTTFGPEVALDPYDDPTWDNVQTGSGQTYQGTAPDFFGTELGSVSSMFFSNGRLYYTLTGQSAMYWRWFEPESGIVGSDEFTTTDTDDWSDAAGAFLSGNTLFFADKSTGQLMSVPWSGTQASSATPVLASAQTDWASRAVFMLDDATHPNKPPVASFTPTCSTMNNSCTFDASSSKDPDGSIIDYAWTFGDGSGADHPDASVFAHAFTSPGTYPVTLTVTDNDGAKTSTTMQVTAGQAASVPTYKGATSGCSSGVAACGKSAVTTVGVPSGTASGDALLLFVSWANNATAATVPSGWHLLDKDVAAPLESDVYYRPATNADVGSTVSVTFAAAVKNGVTLADYSGTSGGSIEAYAKSTASSTASHTTPTANVTTPGSLAVSYWADKSSTTTAWKLPSGVNADQSFYDMGSAYITSQLADSGSTVGVGSYGGKTATTNAASGKAVNWTIILAPAGSTPNQNPVASYTWSCNALTCNFDGTGSHDPDGSVVGWSWDFGDGVTSTSATPTHTFSAAGGHTVALTVTDNQGAKNSTSKLITVSASAPAIAFQGSSTFDGSGTSGQVAVPAGTSNGDTMLLFQSYASTSVTSPAPTGWTLIGSTTTSNLTTHVYEKQATAGDVGSTVPVTYSGTVKSSLMIADYANVSATPIENSASSTAVSTSSHTTPALTALTAGTWVVSYWTDKSTTTTAWTSPAGLTQRAVVVGSGSGADGGLLDDSGAAVSGSYPSHTATTNATSGSAAQWSVALAPAS